MPSMAPSSPATAPVTIVAAARTGVTSMASDYRLQATDSRL
jgi:hypothetical protein